MEAPNTKASNLFAVAIGSLMYAAIGTRPNILFTVQSLSQFTQNPGPEHWIALNRVFRYLQGTQNLGLVYGGALSWPDQILTAYTDADYGSNPNDRRSISGSTYIIAGAAIGWMSKKQSVTATSTCYWEYVAAAACTRHVTWLQNLLLCLGFPQDGPTSVYCDNQATISLTRDFQFHAKSKHIDIHVHLIRDKVSDGTVLVSYVPSEENVADIFTKGLPRIKHEKFVRENSLMPA